MEPVYKQFELIGEDNEINAMAIILEVLKDLDSSGKQRVLNYVQQRTYYEDAPTMGGIAAGQARL